jgi:hypothetical protein
MNGFDLLLYAIGGLIAIILTVLAAVVSSVKYRGVFIALGAASFVVYMWIGFRAYEESKATAWQASQDKAAAQAQLGDIKQQLSDAKVQSAHDIGDLQGQLKIFGQFAPAVLKLAEASELNTRKEYEQKSLTNAQLRDFVSQVVKKMRDWEYRSEEDQRQIENKYEEKVSQINLNFNGLDRKNPLVQQQEGAQVDAAFQAQTEALGDSYLKFQNDFNQNILDDAISARDQLIEKLGASAEPQLDQINRSALYVFRGVIVGSFPVAKAANYLEMFAKKLSP